MRKDTLMHIICLISIMRFKRLLPFLFLVLITGCTRIKEPQFRRVENFHLKNFGLQQATIAFNVVYFNPNNFGVTVKEAAANVYLDSVYWGKFVQDSTIGVKRNSEFSIPLSGAVSLQKVLDLNLQELSQRDILIRANGNVKVGKAGIFITKPFTYQGKHRLDEITLPK